MLDITIKRIEANDTKQLRHLILWPSIPPNSQLYPYDSLPSTIHLGAFSPESNSPIGCLTLVTESYLKPQTLPFPPPSMQVQLRKFAVLPNLQGRGVGRKLFAAAVEECKDIGEGEAVLLHLDSREVQVGFYRKLGLEVLDPEVFGKRGAGGAGPEIPHVRMGRVVQ